jgi:hypothetical protein
MWKRRLISGSLSLPLGEDRLSVGRIVLDPVDRLAGQPCGAGDGAHAYAQREQVPDGPELVAREARLAAPVDPTVFSMGVWAIPGRWATLEASAWAVAAMKAIRASRTAC